MMETPTVVSLCILSIAIIVNAYTLIVLFSIENETPAKKALLLFSAALLFHCLYVLTAIFIWNYGHFIDYGAPFSLIYGPLLWCAVLLITRKADFIKKIRGHFIPFALFGIGYIFCLFHQEKTLLLHYYTVCMYSCTVLQWAFYLLISILKMRKFGDGSREKEVKKLFLNHFFLFCGLAAFIFLMGVVRYYFIGDGKISEAEAPYKIYLFMLYSAILLHWSIVRNLEFRWVSSDDKTDLWNIMEVAQVEMPVKTKEPSGKKHERLPEIAEKINSLSMDLYKENSLTLTQLAALIKEPPHLVTQTFSLELGMNFKSYVNKKRLEIAVALLKEKSYDRTISDVAFQAGFNSEASFYRIFKASYQTSPRKFQKYFHEHNGSLLNK